MKRANLSHLYSTNNYKDEKKLSKKLSTEVLLVNKIDKSLLAGIKIKVGDYIIENSIEGFLNTFKKYSIKG